MMFYFPHIKALCTSEVVTHILHNVYTPRGAKVRDSLAWAKFIHELKTLFPDTEVVFASHHWPIWGKERVQTYLSLQRDLYKYLHDETLRLANHGLTPLEIAEEIQLPDTLAQVFHNRDYYGTVNHNVKAIYQLYFGWFDGNPANLHVLPPEPAAKKYVEFMGGADAIVEKAQGSFEQGDYRWVAQVLNHVMFAEPSHQGAKDLLAEAYTQMGYQAESGPWRDFYLTGAQEARGGSPDIDVPSMHNIETLRAVPLEMIFDEMAVRLNGPKAAGKEMRLHFDFTDAGEAYLVEVSNGVLKATPTEDVSDSAVQIKMDRGTMVSFWGGLKSFDDLVSDGAIEVFGDAAAVSELLGLLDDFKIFFNIVTP